MLPRAIRSRLSTVGFEQPENRRVHSVKPDVVDAQYYRTVETFLKMARGQYEKYDRKGPEIYFLRGPSGPGAVASLTRHRRT
jgi:SpoVK/Ycf46/Vps4 family AAA+-type ATPase